jgi:hypothetical protein
VSFGETFQGFDEAAFAAFETRKWTSNLFNIERMKVRDQLRALGAGLDPELSRGRAFHVDVTNHAPTILNGKKVNELVLYFTRTEEQQRSLAPVLDRRISLPDQIADSGEHHRHATLGVRVSSGGVEVGLMLRSTAWVDVMNLLNRVRKTEEAEELARAVRRLPAGSFVRVAPGREIPAAEFEAPEARAFEEAVLNDAFLILFGRRIPADDVIASGAGFAALCRDVLVACLPVWDYVAWRPASNYLMDDSTRATKDTPTISSDGSIVDYSPGTKVRLVDGVFAGRQGVVTEVDSKGLVRVVIGKVTVRTDTRSVRAV